MVHEQSVSEERYEARKQRSGLLVSLRIHQVNEEDAGLYYCARWDTLHGNTHCHWTKTFPRRRTCKHTHLLLFCTSQRDPATIYIGLFSCTCVLSKVRSRAQEPKLWSFFQFVTSSSTLISLGLIPAFLSVLFSECLCFSIYGKPPGKEAIIQCSTWFVDFEWMMEDTKPLKWQTPEFSNFFSASYRQYDLGKLLNWFHSLFPILSGHIVNNKTGVLKTEWGFIHKSLNIAFNKSVSFSVITKALRWVTSATL